MSLEEQGVLLSAYLDGELDEEKRAEVEQMLEGDAELAVQLEEMKDIGLVLNRALDAEAANVDFRAMEEAVLREVSKGQQVTERAPVQEAGSGMGFWEMLRSFMERPAVAFALGLLVAGGWMRFNPAVQSSGDAGPVKQSTALTAEHVPAAAMRGPEAEQSFSKASPSLVLETLSVESGKVVLDQPGDDPDAPVVLWHFSESSGERALDEQQQRPASPPSGMMKVGDPL